jgi:uncharacterized protein YndB with AHSA1/START domain
MRLRIQEADMNAPDTIEREVLLPVNPEEAWEAITDPDELEAWFADEVEALDLRPGGRAAFRWEGGEREAVVEKVDPGRRLAFRWDHGDAAPDEAGPGTLVELVLVPEPAGTRLIVTESGFDAAALLRTPAWLPRLEARCGALAYA